MKAIILTYSPLRNFEKELIKNTDIFKIALNQHAKELLPNARIITDYVLKKICQSCSEKIISVRDTLKCFSDRVEYPDIEFKGSTIVAAVEYLISKSYSKILIIGDNTVNSVLFQKEVKNEIDKLKDKALIYQYSKGNFNLPVITVSDFITKAD
jgi:hypothetical protein